MKLKLEPLDIKVFTNKQLAELLNGASRESLLPRVHYKRLLGTVYEKHINWKKIHGDDWVNIMTIRPDLFDLCEHNHRIRPSYWSALINKRPEFLKKCKCFNKMTGNEIVSVLIDYPSMNQKFTFDSLNSKDWATLLVAHPRFADKCEMWHLFDGEVWFKLLSEQPQFADKCDWSKLSGIWWAKLLVAQPQFASNCDWSKFFGCDWSILLSSQPQFAPKCDWSKFNDVYWGDLLQSQPQLKKYYKPTTTVAR